MLGLLIRQHLARQREELGSSTAALRVPESWLGEMPMRMAGAERAVREGDTERLREIAHLLRSTCAMVGATHPSELAGAIESHVRNGQLVGLCEVEDLVGAARSAATVVTAWRDTLPIA